MHSSIHRFPLLAVAAVATLALTACGDDRLVEPIGPSTEQVAAASASDVTNGNGVRMIELGNQIFDDRNLSLRRNQSCATCHDPKFGFTAPLSVSALEGTASVEVEDPVVGVRTAVGEAAQPVTPLVAPDPRDQPRHPLGAQLIGVSESRRPGDGTGYSNPPCSALVSPPQEPCCDASLQEPRGPSVHCSEPIRCRQRPFRHPRAPLPRHPRR